MSLEILQLPVEERLGAAVALGVSFLGSQQLATGEFRTYLTSDPGIADCWQLDSTPFPTALICYSLAFCELPQAKEMIDRALKFFAQESEGAGYWRYWTSRHPAHRSIPPDADDLACISYLLLSQQANCPDNKPLLLANRNHQGLFYTWFIPRLSLILSPKYFRAAMRQLFQESDILKSFFKYNEAKPDDIDGVVNANVLLYLGAIKETEAVIEYLIEIVRSNREDRCDKWHHNPLMFYYTVSRCFSAGITALAPIRELIIGRVRESLTKIGDSDLNVALALCTMLNFGEPVRALESGIHKLIDSQNMDGSWNREILYYGGPKRILGWGSAALTTAFCIEALGRYQGLE